MWEISQVQSLSKNHIYVDPSPIIQAIWRVQARMIVINSYLIYFFIISCVISIFSSSYTQKQNGAVWGIIQDSIR